MVIGAILYVVLSFIIDQVHSTSSTVIDLLEGVIFAVLLFFDSVYGPWVGLGTAGIGSSVAHLLRGGIAFRWYLPLYIALLGFIVGFNMLKSQGRYDMRGKVIFATIVGCLELIIYLALLFYTDYLVYHVSIAVVTRFFLNAALFSSVVVLILLSMLLIGYNAVIKRRSQSHP